MMMAGIAPIRSLIQKEQIAVNYNRDHPMT